MRLPAPFTTEYKGALQANVYWPRGSGEHPAVLLIHGGGLSYGSRVDLDSTGARLAANGFVAATIDYTLGAGFAAARLDVDDALEWLRRLDGVDVAKLALAGQSSGAVLAASVGYRDNGVRALVLVSASTRDVIDLVTRAAPETLLVHGTRDDSVPASDAQRLARRLASKRVPHRVLVARGAGHFDAWFREWDEIAAWLGRRLAPSDVNR